MASESAKAKSNVVQHVLRGECMFRFKPEPERFYLTANLRLKEDHPAWTEVKSVCRPFEDMQRFAPIEDLVGSLDNIASSIIPA